MLMMCPPTPHHRGGRLGAEERGAQAQPEQPIVAGDRRGGERRAVEDRGAVDEEVEPAQRPRRLLRQPSRPERW
jgi:hypothetical protein